MKFGLFRCKYPILHDWIIPKFSEIRSTTSCRELVFILHSFVYLALPSEHLHGLQEAVIPHHHVALVIEPLLPKEVGGELEQE